MNIPKVLSVKGRYERLVSDRTNFLDRARQCSELTIPTLIPPLGHTSTTKYYTPWQGLGARGVNTLAAKLLLSLFPPNSPFFRLIVDDYTKDAMAGKPDMKSSIEQAFSKIERAIQSEIEGSGVRSPIFLALKHVIVGGNALVYLPPEGGMRVFPLDNYVCKRDATGSVLEVITLENLSPLALDDDIVNLIHDNNTSSSLEKKESSPNSENVELYTRFYRDGSQWRMFQEVCGKRVPNSEGSWPLDKRPFMALRWTPVEGEDYGRSYVEEYLGDLVSLEGLSKAIVEAAAASAKVVFLVSPNGVTRAEDITEAESGDAISGVAGDVHALQTEKQADLSIAYQAVQTISERLSYAFLLNSAVQRNGERVTAEEIRYVAGELEDALGGVYSILSQEFQAPFAIRVMDRMTKQKRLPDLPKGVVKPVVVTGLEALGRGHDLTKLQLFGQQVLAPLGPNAFQYVNMPEYLLRGATALGIDPAGLIKTPEQIQQEQEEQQEAVQQQQLADLAGKAAGPGIKAASDQITNAGQQMPPQG